MSWLYVLLMVLVAICAIASVILFLLCIACDAPEALWVVLVAIAITVGAGIGVHQIEKKNTTVETEVVQMEIVKLDLSAVRAGGRTIKQYAASVSNGAYHFVVEINEEEYVTYKEGDKVEVKITTTNKFDTVTQKGEIIQ